MRRCCLAFAHVCRVQDIGGAAAAAVPSGPTTTPLRALAVSSGVDVGSHSGGWKLPPASPIMSRHNDGPDDFMVPSSPIPMSHTAVVGSTAHLPLSQSRQRSFASSLLASPVGDFSREPSFVSELSLRSPGPGLSGAASAPILSGGVRFEGDTVYVPSFLAKPGKDGGGAAPRAVAGRTRFT